MTSPVLLPYATIGVTLKPCKVPLPLCTSAKAHKIACSKGGQQGDAFEIVRFAVTTFPSFGRVFARHVACTGAAICDEVFIVVPLAESLALAAELKQVLNQDLDLDVPKFNCFFPGD